MITSGQALAWWHQCEHGQLSWCSHWWYIECFSEAKVCQPARTVWRSVSLETVVQKFFSTFCPLTSLAPHHCTMTPSLPQTYSKKEVCASSGPLFSLALIRWIISVSVFHLHYCGFQHQYHVSFCWGFDDYLIPLLCVTLIKVSVYRNRKRK